MPILAAGAPWFMTVFGRDSLLTAWMTLIAEPALAEGVLETLARFQGDDVNLQTEEEPGKILHEMRFGTSARSALGSGEVYYGSIDATPLFVMLLGELRRWDVADDLVDRLLPHADRALEWIERFGDRDGDGYVEYGRRSDRGLANQGWKDSWDAIRFLDGELAHAPIALCEVQGYVYSAYIARAHFAREAGDHDARAGVPAEGPRPLDAVQRGLLARRARLVRARARRRQAPHRRAGVEPGPLPLDRDHRSRPGRDRGEAHDVRRDVLGLGPAYAGGVDGGVQPGELPQRLRVAARQRDRGRGDDALRLRGGGAPCDRARSSTSPPRSADGCPSCSPGFERGHPATPAAYPTSCSPQAWASAAPLLWLRSLLRVDPWATHEEVRIAPALPPWIRRLRVDGVEIAGRRLCVSVEDDNVEITGEEGLQVIRAPRLAVAPTQSPDAW